MNTETVQERVGTEAEAPASAGALGEGLHRVVESTKQLLRSTADVATGGVAAARSQLKERLDGAGDKLGATQTQVTERVRHSAGAAKEYVEEHPWTVAGISAVAGLFAGYLVSRRVGANRHGTRNSAGRP